ncbi:MAG: hypothetical protein DVB22_001763 [Verrucomicrobia bacterium]|nr:MAG: hypothetical protein DVB22_001763 [Verrucomicrobiota bacterium]
MTRLIALFLTACAPPASTDQPPKNPPKETASESVPEPDNGYQLHSDPSGRPYFAEEHGAYLTQFLAAMKEPSLFDRGDKRPEFEVRFLWLRTFHDPISIRIWSTPKGYMVRTVRIKQNEDYSLAGTLVDTTRLLDDAETKAFTAALTKAPLAAPMNETEETAGDGGIDGASWIFESSMEKKYQKLDFWCLEHFGPIRYETLVEDTSKIRDTSSLLKFALTLLELSKLNIPKEDIY